MESVLFWRMEVLLPSNLMFRGVAFVSVALQKSWGIYKITYLLILLLKRVNQIYNLNHDYHPYEITYNIYLNNKLN